MCFQIKKRYSDFASLVESLKFAGMDLPLPPKKLLGNMEREFIAERQKGLQRLMDTILAHPLLSASEIVKKFLDANNYTLNVSGKLCSSVNYRTVVH